MKFFNWVEKHGGSRGIARLIETESPTVNAWLNGVASPKVETIIKLVKVGRGAFTAEDVINDTLKAKAKKQ